MLMLHAVLVGVQGNFDLVVENDDLDQAVRTLTSRLVEWFPKIKKTTAAGESMV